MRCQLPDPVTRFHWLLFLNKAQTPKCSLQGLPQFVITHFPNRSSHWTLPLLHISAQRTNLLFYTWRSQAFAPSIPVLTLPPWMSALTATCLHLIRWFTAQLKQHREAMCESFNCSRPQLVFSSSLFASLPMQQINWNYDYVDTHLTTPLRLWVKVVGHFCVTVSIWAS